MPSEPSGPSAVDVAPPRRPQTGLNFFVSSTLDEVQEAWGLVYQAYLRDDLIDVNPHEIHTTLQAAGPRSAVILGCMGPLLVSTLSVYTDERQGLPLDTVYLQEIDALRQSGRKLMEVGLFADRREHLNRSAEGLFELMRFAYYFALNMKVDDAIIGVIRGTPLFYMRLLGFDRIGPVRSYPTVKDRAVVLLRYNLREGFAADRMPKGLAHFVHNPVSPDAFERRFRFDSPNIFNSRIGKFLADKRAALASVA